MNRIDMQCSHCQHMWRWLSGSPMLCPQCGHVHSLGTTGDCEQTQHTEKCAKNQTIAQNGAGKATNRKPLSEIDGILYEPLSLREIEVLCRVIQGESNRQIAEQLMISDRTVESHLTSIYGKLHVQNRTHATARALQSGLINLQIRVSPDL